MVTQAQTVPVPVTGSQSNLLGQAIGTVGAGREEPFVTGLTFLYVHLVLTEVLPEGLGLGFHLGRWFVVCCCWHPLFSPC